MKKLYFIVPLLVLLFAACSKRDYIPAQNNPRDWMRTHEEAIVAYVDYSTGNYVVETYQGFSVIELWEDIGPVEGDYEYAYFNNRGVQTIYNRSGDYFTKGRVVESYLSWSEAMYILDDLKYGY